MLYPVFDSDFDAFKEPNLKISPILRWHLTYPKSRIDCPLFLESQLYRLVTCQTHSDKKKVSWRTVVWTPHKHAHQGSKALTDHRCKRDNGPHSHQGKLSITAKKEWLSYFVIPSLAALQLVRCYARASFSYSDLRSCAYCCVTTNRTKTDK